MTLGLGIILVVIGALVAWLTSIPWLGGALVLIGVVICLVVIIRGASAGHGPRV
jgi:hypothetical protein